MLSNSAASCLYHSSFLLLIASAPHCTIHIGRETSRLRVRCCVEDDETLGGSLVPPSYHDFTQCQLCKSGCVNENELKSR